MFDQINGLPVHALVLHAAVVFVPLLAAGAVAYALVARWRPRLGWAVALLAVAAPVSTLVAKLSGEKLYDRLVGLGLQGPTKETLDEHMGYGGRLLLFTVALSVVSLVMVGLTWRAERASAKVVRAGLGVAMIVLAAVSGYYVYRTGDSGATAGWGSN